MARSPASDQRDLVEAAHRRPWRDLPERYGPWKTAHERLRKWTMDDAWEKILDAAVVKDDAVGEVEWIVFVDSMVVRAHQQSRPSRSGENASDAPREN